MIWVLTLSSNIVILQSDGLARRNLNSNDSIAYNIDNDIKNPNEPQTPHPITQWTIIEIEIMHTLPVYISSYYRPSRCYNRLIETHKWKNKLAQS